jgi:hypothetical protein
MSNRAEPVRIAVLDDYQNVALSMADWSGLDKRAAITALICLAQQRMALLVSSVPLLTMVLGLPRLAIRRSSSRATLRPESEVSAMAARHSCVQSSKTCHARCYPKNPMLS